MAPRLRPRALVLGALVLLAAASAATAADPAKPGDPAPAGARGGAVAHEAGPATGQRLLVTFADTPSRAAAERRIGSLGTVVPVLPEAGVWGLEADRPAGARSAVLARADVTGAEWSAVRRSAERRPRPKGPQPPGPAPPIGDRFFAEGSQWGLAPATSLWGADLTTGTRRPAIAILDSGIDPAHEEWGGPNSPLRSGRSTWAGGSDARDWGTTGHGTHVAGVAAAPANGVGIVGVAPASAQGGHVIPVQIADPAGRSTDETMIRGIRHAVRAGAKVINISAGGPGFSRAFQETVLWATHRGALIVASVGNEGEDSNTLNYPAAYARVLGVGAQCDGVVTVDCPRPFGPAAFSNRNRSVDVIAPGVNVLSSVPVRVTERAVAPGYALKDGTSMATPYVTGLAALVLASNDDPLAPYQVMRQIQNTATDVPPRGRDNRSGYGIVNPRAAVTLRAPADDPEEVNDDIKWVRGHKRLPARGPLEILATADRLHDPDDVYAVLLRKGQRVRLRLTHARGSLDLYLWRPGTRTVTTSTANLRRNLIAFQGRRGSRPKSIVYTAKVTGRHYVNVFARSGRSDYRLTITRA